MNLQKVGILVLFLFILASSVNAYWGCANCYYNPSIQNLRVGYPPIHVHAFPAFVTGYQPFVAPRFSYSYPYPVQFLPTNYNGLYRSLPYPSTPFYSGPVFYP